MSATGSKQHPRAATRAARLSELARAYSLADMYAFGSRAGEIAAMMKSGRALKRTSSSDVDIGVRPKQSSRLSPRDLLNLAVELEDLFGASRVDLVLLPGSEPFLALDIIKGELLYTEDPLDQAYFELFVLRRAGDLLPFKRERIDMILRGPAR
jgi:predicted nucleotidyltransferase